MRGQCERKWRGTQWSQRLRRQPADRWELRSKRKRPVCRRQTTVACWDDGLVSAVQQLCRNVDETVKLVINLNRSVRCERSKSTAPQGNRWGKGRRAVSGYHLLDSVRGAGIPTRVGIPGEAHGALGLTSLADAHRESAMLDPSGPVRHGRSFGELGSILCGHSWVLGRDPPVFSAGSTGKSLNT